MKKDELIDSSEVKNGEKSIEKRIEVSLLIENEFVEFLEGGRIRIWFFTRKQEDSSK